MSRDYLKKFMQKFMHKIFLQEIVLVLTTSIFCWNIVAQSFHTKSNSINEAVINTTE